MMPWLNTIGWISLILAYAIASWVVLLRFLQYFQQEEYNTKRFLRWWIVSNSFEMRATSLALVFTLTSLFALPESYLIFCIAAVIFALAIALAAISNRPQNTKKALVMTSRATRIFAVAYGLQLFWLAFDSVFFASWFNEYCTLPYLPVTLFFIALYFILAPLWIVLANWLLWPFEWWNQRRFYREAQTILAEQKPKTIGITGSYGKTSIKQILSHVLNAHAPTLATPGSVNTVMGIARIIREKLTRDHRHFIVEMGAYGVGSIARLCRFTPPDIGIVTFVGLAHYERFKSEEAVFEAKSELPQHVPEGGFVILNGDNKYCRRMAERTNAQAFFYGKNPDVGELHCRLVEDEIVPEGLRCVFEYEGAAHSVVLPVYGAHQAMNAAGAFLTAMKLGVPAITALAALKTLPQIDHRLVVQTAPGGVTVIDDAYNSNPVGFQNALDVLRVLPGNRKILITPGMIELGAKEKDEHQKLAPKIAECCDLVCLVAPERIPWFRDMIIDSGMDEASVKAFDSLADARAFLDQTLNAGDVILYENDLPDLYESNRAFRML